MVLVVVGGAVGVGVGLLWAAVAPRSQATVGADGGLVVYDEVEALFGADARLGGLGLAAGALVALVAFAVLGVRRAAQPPVLVGLVLGGLLGSFVAQRVGQWRAGQEPAAAGPGDVVTAALDLHAPGMLVCWALCATLVHLALVAGFVDEQYDDLPASTRPDPDVAAAEPGPADGG